MKSIQGTKTIRGGVVIIDLPGFQSGNLVDAEKPKKEQAKLIKTNIRKSIKGTKTQSIRGGVVIVEDVFGF